VKGLVSLFIGLFGTFAFSWVGLTMIPNWQIGHLDPQTDEEGSDAYPVPKSGMAERGRKIYTGNGCYYCHSEWIRADYAGSDIDRKWGERRSAPRDYIFARPVALGKMRTGPDLSNIGKRAPVEDENAPAGVASPSASPAAAGSPAPSTSPPPAPQKNQPAAGAPAPAPAPNASPAASPNPSPTPATKPGEPPQYSAAWHHRHLYSPRSVNIDSDMPAYRFLYEKQHISGEPSVNALKLGKADAPPEGWEIVPTYDAECLVAYLMSLDQSHPLKEVKSGAPAAAPAASPAAAPATSPPPAAAAPKK
jgi:cytochrome c oxidase cbb3-type subunit 2